MIISVEPRKTILTMIDISDVKDISEIDSLLAKLKASKKALKEAAKKQKLDVVAIAQTLSLVTQSVLDAQKAYGEKGFLVEIEKETILLVTFKNYYAMKKTMYLTSVLVTAFMILFSLFKIFHLPGAGELFVITVVLFSSLFLPLVILIKLKDESKKTEKMGQQEIIQK